MKKYFITVFLLMCLLLLCGNVTKAAEDTSIEAFVTRFYVHILDRQPDGGGLAAWSENLRSGKEAGVNVGYGFVQSDEFKNRNLNDEEYIKVLYRAFFDREADAGGLNAWKQVLDSGLSRLHVYKGFAESAEFTGVCVRYGINRGTITLTAPMDQNEGVTKFVARCYNLCLGRRADEAGLNAWCSQLLSGANSAKQAAHGFVFSDEFLKKNLSDREYVKVLYRVFMDREADSAGLESWVKVLTNGKSREHVFSGFADSNEFKKICDGYGIYAGEPSPPEVETWKTEYVKLIQDYRNKYPMSGVKFALTDIDSNQIPELILSYGYDDEFLLYTVSREKVIQLMSEKLQGMGEISMAIGTNGEFAIEKTDGNEHCVMHCRLNGSQLTIFATNRASVKDLIIEQGYRWPVFWFLDSFNGSIPVGEITVNNIEHYIR